MADLANSQPLISGLLDFSAYYEKKAAEEKKAKMDYEILVEDLHKNFDNPATLYGVEQKIIDIVKFIATEDLQKEFHYFDNLASSLKKKSEPLEKELETTYSKVNVYENPEKNKKRDKLLYDATLINEQINQAMKIAIIFGSALKEKSRIEERDRRILVGAKLKMLREMQGLSLDDVAKALDTNKSLISNYESGYREPSIKNLIKLATKLNTSTDWLLNVPAPRYNSNKIKA